MSNIYSNTKEFQNYGFCENCAYFWRMNVVKNFLFCVSLIGCSLLIIQKTSAQPLELSKNKLLFGGVTELIPDSLPIVLRNPSSSTLTVTEIRFYDTYGESAFSTRNTPFTIPPADSQSIYITFSPRHNIYHNTEMVIFTDTPKGTIAVDLQGQGIYSNLYYRSTENKSEQELKDALSTRLAQGYNQLSYNQARDEMYMIIDNQKTNGQGAAQNTLEGVYTGSIVSNYTNRTDAQSQGFNTEHTFPQSFFNQNLPMRSDLFHLFPTLATANSERGNFPFGVVSQASWQMGGSKRGNNLFEPRDIHKGTVARAMMYFVLRYEDYQGFFAPQESMLRLWHKDFPPTAINQRRNEDISSVQGNRNPFIDYPQMIDRITTLSGNSVAADLWEADLTEAEINFGTVAAQTDYVYRYVIVNTGNQALSVSNLSLTDSRLHFGQQTGQDTTIQAGESLTLELLLYSPQEMALNAQLQFQTNIPNQANVSIPIQANINGTTAISRSNDGFRQVKIFPQPASGEVTIYVKSASSEKIRLEIRDLRGRRIADTYTIEPDVQTTLDLPVIASGTYLLYLAQANHFYVQRLLLY